MKEIKLKVWDKVKKRMFKPLAITFDIQSQNPFAVSIPGRSWEPIHKFEILQNTGLTDKNGVEVYQGDLFEIESNLFKVIWNDSMGCFSLQGIKSSSTQMITKVLQEEIRGNIYQNSDLL
jgi:hypothetical protein